MTSPSSAETAVDRLHGWLAGTFAYKAYRGRAPDGVPQLRSDIRAILDAPAPAPAPTQIKAGETDVVVPYRLASNLYRFLNQLSASAFMLKGMQGDITGNAHLYAVAIKEAFDGEAAKPGETIGGEALDEQIECLAKRQRARDKSASDGWPGWDDIGEAARVLYRAQARGDLDAIAAIPKGNAEGVKALAETVGGKIEALLSEERQGAFIGLHQVRAIKEIEDLIRSTLIPSPISGEVAEGLRKAIDEFSEKARDLRDDDATRRGRAYAADLLRRVLRDLATQPTTQPEGDGK